MRELHLLSEHPQAALQLLRSCIAIPKMMFALRVCNPLKITDAVGKFDLILNQSLAQIVGIKEFSAHQRQLLELPIRAGGFGIPAAKSIMWSAYTGSQLLTANLQKQISATASSGIVDILAKWSEIHGSLSLDETVSVINSRKPQSYLAAKVADGARLNLVTDNNVPPILKANLATRSMDSSRWSLVPPILKDNLTMDADLYRKALQFNLSFNVYDRDERCVCKKLSNASGTHDIHCAIDGRLRKRHEAVKHLLHGMFKAADIDAVEEVRGIFDSSEQRPADIFLPAFSLDTRQTCLDVTIVSPFTKTFVDDEHLLDAERLKLHKYQRQCDNINLNMTPFAMDCFGKLGPMAISVVGYLAKITAKKLNISEPAARSEIVNKLCFTTMKLTAAAILNRQLPGRSTFKGRLLY